MKKKIRCKSNQTKNKIYKIEMKVISRIQLNNKKLYKKKTTHNLLKCLEIWTKISFLIKTIMTSKNYKNN